ncbi:NAD-dependent epimerase/dehydratase family protein [Alkalihalobacillus sp. FSL W8-0930]
MNKVLVMGGTEFISKALVVDLIKSGYSVDFVTRGHKKVDFHGFNKHLIADRKDKRALRNIFKDNVYNYIFDVSGYTKEDVENVVESVDQSCLKRYTFISSGAVYLSSETLLIETNDRGFNPNWKDYGYNKKKAEDYLSELYNKTGFPCVIFRPSYVYGEGNNLKRETFLFSRADRSIPIVIPLSGAAFVQFIHIHDVIKVLLATMDDVQVNGEAYNLTHPEEVDWLTLVKTVKQVVNKDFNVKGITKETMDHLNITLGSFFPFRDLTYLLDICKLSESGLPVPSISLEKGLARTYKWYLEQNHLIDTVFKKEYDKVIAASKTIDDE